MNKRLNIIVNILKIIFKHLVAQIAIFIVFGLLVYYLFSSLFNLNNTVLYLNLAIWMMASFILFYIMGIKTTTTTRLNRFYFFIFQAFIFVIIGILQGNEFGDVLTWLINQLCRYWLPIFQIVCMLGYNLGLRNEK